MFITIRNFSNWKSEIPTRNPSQNNRPDKKKKFGKAQDRLENRILFSSRASLRHFSGSESRTAAALPNKAREDIPR